MLICHTSEEFRLRLRDWFFCQVYADPNSGCWLWLHGAKGTGYGAVKLDGKQYPAHRLSWELFRGAIPPGHSVLHKCDVRLCCNPNHLFTGTQMDNLLDAIAKGRALPFHRLASLGGRTLRKLSHEQVEEIREHGGVRGQQIAMAKRFGVHPNTVYYAFHYIHYSYSTER